MSVEKNETAIQALKIMYAVSSKNTKKKLTKTHYSKPYPKGIEAHYKTMLTNFFRPLVKFVDEFLQENSAALLRGDSVDIRCDAMPGGTFRKMVEQMEGWLAVYMPTVPEMQAGQNNVVFMGLGETADSLKKYEDKQFQKQLQSGIGVQFQTNAPWWAGTKASWAQNNYSLITSNARNYVSQINTLAEQAVVNGLSVNQLQEQIKKASAGLTDKKCRLLARDQIGKLQGQIAQAQMEEVGLEMYVWETSGDERVRGNPNGKYPQASPSHFLMDGLLCRWDDAGVCSKDGGKTWESRPANAVKLHPGQDIQCRCIALVYMPELLFEVSGERLETTNAVEEIVEISAGALEQYILQQQKDVTKSISHSEKQAFWHYTQAYYNPVNAYLEDRDILFSNEHYAKKYINKMDKAMIKAKPLDIDITLFRTEFSNGSYDPVYKKGEIVTFKKFVSTSIAKDKAKCGGKLKYEILVPKGIVAGIYIAPFSGHNEMEFLLNRNMRYFVTGVSEAEGTKTIFLKLLGVVQ